MLVTLEWLFRALSQHTYVSETLYCSCACTPASDKRMVANDYSMDKKNNKHKESEYEQMKLRSKMRFACDGGYGNTAAAATAVLKCQCCE